MSEKAASSPAPVLSPLQLTTTFADAASKLDRVIKALEGQGISVSTGGSVGSLFAKVRRLNKEHAKNPDGYDRVKLLAATEGLWIAEALEIAVGQPGSHEAIERIIHSQMNMSDRAQSQGKDVLWELDLFRRLKFAGADVRLAEPDLILQLGGGLGDYAIACKKVYSEASVEAAFGRGCDQLKRKGLPGVVALNLDDCMEEKVPLHAISPAAFQAEITLRAREFVTRHAHVFEKRIKQGRLDGVLISITMLSEVLDAWPSINLARTLFLFPEPSALRDPAKARLSAFLQWTNRILLGVRY